MITQLMKYKDFEYEDRDSRIYGVVTAIVTNNEDPDGMARIKLKFPWMGEAKESETHWARIATFMGGNERGSYFIPEVDDEVLVAFENGDINHPYMIGALWNGKDKPTEKNDDGKNNIRSFTSRSGHKITFDDKDGEEKVIIADSSEKRTITFDVKEKIIEIKNDEDKGEIKIISKGKISVTTEDELSIEAKKDITIKTDKDISLDCKNFKVKTSANVEIKSGSKVAIESKAGMKIEAKADLKVKASSGAKIESGGTLDVKGTGPTTVESSAILTVKGAMVKIN